VIAARDADPAVLRKVRRGFDVVESGFILCY
jgi:hypothetical protein